MRAGAVTRARFLVPLIHFPSVFVSIAAAGVILAGTAAGGVTFQSAAQTAAIRSAIQHGSGIVLEVSAQGPLTADIVSFRQRQLVLGARELRSIGPPTVTLVGSTVRVVARSKDATHATEVQLISRSGFASHVVVQQSAARTTNGVWLADTTAQILDARPGGRVTLVAGNLRSTVPVEGIYRNLLSSKPSSYWSPLAGTIYGNGPGQPPRSPLLSDEQQFLSITTALEDSGTYDWSFPLTSSTPPTYSSIAALRAGAGQLERRIGDPSTQIGAALQQPTVAGDVGSWVEAAQSAHRAIAEPVGTLAVAGEVVALVAIGAAAVYGVRRRISEVRMLNAIGFSVGRMGVRSIVEGILPLALGSATGWMLGSWAARAFGPSRIVQSSAVRTATLETISLAAVALAVFGIVTAFAARSQIREAPQGRLVRLAGRLAWELPVLVLAAAAYNEIEFRGTTPTIGTGGAPRIDWLLLLFPMLFVAGIGGLAVRLFSAALRKLPRRTDRWPVFLYMATSRLTSAPKVATYLITACCLAAGILVYSGTVVASARTILTDNVMVSVGSDVAITTTGPVRLLNATPTPMTSLVQLPLATVTPSGRSASVIGVDPRTFARAAFWDPRFASRPLGELLASLSTPNGSLPVILVGRSSPPPTSLVVNGTSLPIRTVAFARAFPGELAGLNLVTSARALQGAMTAHGGSLSETTPTYETWARGNASKALAYIQALGGRPLSVVTAESEFGAPGALALTWAFGFMRALGVLTAFVGLIGLLLYLQARQRLRVVSYALSRRMGLSPVAHWSALASELLGLLATAAIIGVVAGVAGAALIANRLSVSAVLPPVAYFTVPARLLRAGFSACLGGAGIGAWIVHERVRHARVAEVMRFVG
jgi:putative ABC transport system permease protein